MYPFSVSTPLYIQIAERLIDQIESGELVMGDQLPPERELCKIFSVSRLTLRRSIAILEAQGLIDRLHGIGNFIAKPKIERRASRLVSFTSGMQRRGLKPGARVITMERIPAQAALAKRLDTPIMTLVYAIRRLRMINQEPVMLEQFWTPVHLAPELESFDLDNRSIYEIMETEFGILITKAKRTLEPTIASEYEAELLGDNDGAPLMLERRLGFDQNELCVEFSKDLYRGDRFRFTTEDVLREP